ncbi:unnamed protein product [Urochloa humidicola]
MQLFHFIAALLFPGAGCATAKMATNKAMTAESSEPDNASSLAFSVKAADDSRSSISSSSSSPSSSSDEHPRFFASRHHQQQSPPASPLCFGAGGAVGKLLRGSRAARARSPTKKEEKTTAASTAPAPTEQGDVVGRYLRKISRRLRKARAAASKVSPPSHIGGAVDDTARERAEDVARAIAYCKETLRRGDAAPPPAPSLDDLLHGRQDENIASAAAYRAGSADSKMQAAGGDGRARQGLSAPGLAKGSRARQGVAASRSRHNEQVPRQAGDHGRTTINVVVRSR